jgi:hypothetical protein
MRSAKTSMEPRRRGSASPLLCAELLPGNRPTGNPPADAFPGVLRRLRFESIALLDQLGATTGTVWDARVSVDADCTLKDRTAQLAYLDDATLLALTQPVEFRSERATLPRFGDDLFAWVSAQHRHLSPQTVLAWFADSRHQLLHEYRHHDPHSTLPWFTGDTTVGMSVTDRLTDRWCAHGLFAERSH